MALYLCIDCGGTKSAAVVANAKGDILGRGRGGPANFKDVSLTRFVSSVRSAVEAALTSIETAPANTVNDQPQLSTDSAFKASQHSCKPKSRSNHHQLSLAGPRSLFKAAWIGASGVDRPQDILDLTPLLSDLLCIPAGPRLIIENDAVLLASPIDKYPHIHTVIVAICGTGSIAMSFGTRDHGRLQRLSRTGGWGWILGDEGSGYYIGREALRRILDNSDHGQTWSSSSASSAPSQGLAPWSENASLITLLPSPLTSVESTSSHHDGSPNGRTPTLQDHIFKHFGITSASDIFSVVYAPDPPTNSPTDLSTPASESHLGGRTGGSDKSSRGTSPGSLYLEMERKVRLSALAPIVFHSALSDKDPTALDILRTSSLHTAHLVAKNLAPIADGGPVASECILCFGGSLVSVKEYRDMVVGHLNDNGHVFSHVEFVDDATESGVLRLVNLFETPQGAVTVSASS